MLILIQQKGWYFPKDFNQKTETSDQFIDSKFALDPWNFFTREIIQNSLDASDGSGKPVIVKFDLKQLSLDKIPGGERIREIIDICSKGTEHDQTKHAYKNAVKKLNQPFISCLKVSDFNTTGIDENFQNIDGQIVNRWKKLLNDIGSGSKNSKQSAGSHGLGKKTSFLVSSINTVYYSSTFLKKENPQTSTTLFQGRSILISWKSEDNQRNVMDGWFGDNDENRDVTDVSEPFRSERDSAGNKTQSIGFSIDDYFIRGNEPGADVIIPAPRFDNNSEFEDTKQKILMSVIENFFLGIVEGKLAVDVFGVQINSTSIYEVTNEIYQNNNVKFKKVNNSLVHGNLLNLQNAYLNGEKSTLDFNFENQKIGEIEIYFLSENTENKKYYSLYRTHGMKIQDQPIFTAESPFSAIVVIRGDDFNEALRRIENPAHDDFETEGKFLGSENNIMDKSAKIVKEMRNKIRSYFLEKTKQPVTDEQELDAPYLSLDGNSSKLTEKPIKFTTPKPKKIMKGKDDKGGKTGVKKTKRKKKGTFGSIEYSAINEFEIPPFIHFSQNTYFLAFQVKDKNLKEVYIELLAENTIGGTNHFEGMINYVRQNGSPVITNNNNFEIKLDNLGKSGIVEIKFYKDKIYKLIPFVFKKEKQLKPEMTNE